MKRIFFISVLILFMQFLNAQTILNADKFIEVKVTDTLKVLPDYIEAFVKFDDKKEINFDDYSDTKENDDQMANSMLAEQLKEEKLKKDIENKIKEISNEYSFIENTENLFSKSLQNSSNGYLVKLHNIDQYNNLSKAILQIEGVSISIKNIELRNKETYNSLLIEKTMNTAYKEATIIAKSMNVIIDKAISVKNYEGAALNYGDIFGSNNSGSNYMNALFSMMGNMFATEQKDNHVVLSKTLIVKYIYK